jgi:Ca2+-binding EF-hand superfamily protein
VVRTQGGLPLGRSKTFLPRYKNKLKKDYEIEDKHEREAFIRNKLRSLLRKMDVGDTRELHGFEQFNFEMHQHNWEMLLHMIRSRTKDNRAWTLVKRIKETRQLYWNILKKTQAIN